MCGVAHLKIILKSVDATPPEIVDLRDLHAEGE